MAKGGELLACTHEAHHGAPRQRTISVVLLAIRRLLPALDALLPPYLDFSRLTKEFSAMANQLNNHERGQHPKEKVTIRLQAETVRLLSESASKIGKSLPGYIADTAESLKHVPPERLHRALAAMMEEGRRL